MNMIRNRYRDVLPSKDYLCFSVCPFSSTIKFYSRVRMVMLTVNIDSDTVSK